MKAIIPIAGKGSRLRPYTYTVPKPLISIAGNAIIDYIIEETKKANIDEWIFIIGYMGEEIKDYIKTHYKGENIHFIHQKNSLGLGHAIYQAKKSFGEEDEPCFIVLGDQLFKADWKAISEEKTNYIGIMKVDDPSRFGIVELDKDKKIISMEEKPETPKSDLAITGMYYFYSSKSLFAHLEALINNNIKSHGEYQLTDAMQAMLKDNEIFKTFEISEWLDCGNKETLLKTHDIVLSRMQANQKGIVNNSVIIPPVYIEEDVVITNSIIGPNVSISAGTQIDHSIIRNSMIGDDSILKNKILKNSLIGNRAHILANEQEYNIVHDSEVE